MCGGGGCGCYCPPVCITVQCGPCAPYRPPPECKPSAWPAIKDNILGKKPEAPKAKAPADKPAAKPAPAPQCVPMPMMCVMPMPMPMLMPVMCAPMGVGGVMMPACGGGAGCTCG